MKFKILFLLIFSSSFAQVQNGEILYSIQFAGVDDIQDNPIINDFLDTTKKGLSKLEYSLTFNKEFSNFKNNYDGIIDEDREIALIFSNAENQCVTNLETNKNHFVISESELFKKNEFILVTDVATAWEITNNTKLINNYRCYEAKLTISKEVSQSNKNKVITAWFTSEIPLSLGPNGYSGLPGLILELKDNNVLFFAHKINLNIFDNLLIKLPVNGKIVDITNYNRLINERIIKASKY
jgi:GLPGLI family protein